MHHGEREHPELWQRRHAAHRSGAVLLEILISIAIFIGAATFVLRTTKNVLDRVDYAQREQRAADLARSLLAELELGTINLASLRDGLPAQLGSNERFGEQMDARADRTGVMWNIDVATERSPYEGLTLVELTVEETSGGRGGALGADTMLTERDPSLVRYTLRQLIALREDGEAEAYQPDEAFEDLPSPPMEPSPTGGAG